MYFDLYCVSACRLYFRYLYYLLLNASLSGVIDKMIIRMPIDEDPGDDDDAQRTVRKLRRETRLSQGFASVVDLIDYKLVRIHAPFAPGLHSTGISYSRYLTVRAAAAAAAASAQPCFSADKLNRPFYFGPRYILTALRSLLSPFFSFFFPSLFFILGHFIRAVTSRHLI